MEQVEGKWCPLCNLICRNGVVRVQLGPEDCGTYQCRFWGARWQWDPGAERQYRKTDENCLLVFRLERP